MTAPTEAEIRAAIMLGLAPSGVELSEEVFGALEPFLDCDKALVRAGWTDDFFPPDDHPGTLWADLRQSESEELRANLHKAIERVERAATGMLVEEIVAVGVAFATAHPDVPRGRWRLPESPPAKRRRLAAVPA